MKMKKFLAKHLCFCCSFGLCDQENKKTTIPNKQQTVEIHDIVTKTNGKESLNEKQTYVNNAFKGENSSAFTKQKLNVSKHNRTKTRQMRQLSDLSEIFRLPLPDEKSLSEIVIEEFDSKSRTLRARRSDSSCDYKVNTEAFSSSNLNSTDEILQTNDKPTDKTNQELPQPSDPESSERKTDRETEKVNHQEPSNEEMPHDLSSTASSERKIQNLPTDSSNE